MNKACKKVIGQLKKEDFSYITATHDKINPRSRNVMKNFVIPSRTIAIKGYFGTHLECIN